MAPQLSRRSFLSTGAAAAAVVAGGSLLAACGSDDAKTTATPVGAGSPPPTAEGLVLGRFFPGEALAATGRQRLPFTLMNAADGSMADEVPTVLRLAVERDGQPVSDPVEVPVHADGLERPYYPLVVDGTGPGIYTVRGEVDGQALESSYQVGPTSAVKQVGDAITPVPTPTVADRLGHEILCTQPDGPCPWHQVSLDAAVAAGGPVALFIATPEYCTTAICGPVLDVALAVAEEFPNVTFVHSEVYRTAAGAQNATATDLVPLLAAQGLTYEPVAFLLRAGGEIAHRLDVVWDTAELRTALGSLR